MYNVAVCFIATNDYLLFAAKCIDSARQHFLKGHEVTYHVFSNNTIFGEDIVCHKIQHGKWPEMTLKRYHIMLHHADLKKYDYVYYLDADSLFVSDVGDEILQDLVAVSHPGYYIMGGGAWEDRRLSACFVEPSKRQRYVCGGFQGGRKFVKVMPELIDMINADKDHGLTPKWHDESAWNKYFVENKKKFTILGAEYMMPESMSKRKAWRIGHYEPKILALEKDHNQIRK